MSKKHRTVSIDVYDEDGTFCESIGGKMSREDVKHQMIEILRNDGIPVIRVAGKHEAAEDTMIGKAMKDKLPELKDIAEKVLKDFPMVLEYEFDGIRFHAAGHPLDVHAANNALLKRIFEED